MNLYAHNMSRLICYVSCVIYSDGFSSHLELVIRSALGSRIVRHVYLVWIQIPSCPGTNGVINLSIPD